MQTGIGSFFVCCGGWRRLQHDSNYLVKAIRREKEGGERDGETRRGREIYWCWRQCREEEKGDDRKRREEKVMGQQKKGEDEKGGEQ